jgi:protein-L-isoaspartate O-methyltransferase
VADGGDLEVSEGLTPHAATNREAWAKEAASYVAGAERNWATEEIAWGILKVPESEVEMLGDVAGKDVVELGCGTAYVSSWLARRGARVTGVDLTHEQLETALTSYGFEVERLVELRNPGHDSGRYNAFTAEWAERWPAEEMWKARKVA